MPSPYVNNYGVVEITAGGATSLTAAAHAGQTIVSNLAATQTWTLPAATGTGNVYRIHIETTKTGDHVIQVASASDVINGGVVVATDTSGITVPTAAASDTITLNGTTTGGVAGSNLVITDVASGLFTVSGFLVSTGAEATPFSADVS